MDPKGNEQDVTKPDFSLSKGETPTATETTSAEQSETQPETQSATKSPEEQINELKEALAEKDKVISENSGKIEEQSSQMEALQESLDAALESIQFPNSTPEAEPVEETKDETEPEAKPEETATEEEVPDDLAKEIEETLAEGSEPEKTQPEVIEELLMDNEVRNLKDELNSALTKYPNANKGEILLAIEDGSDLSVDELAQKSAERITNEKEATRKALEESIKKQFSKENEGSISVPQSSGGSSTPTNANAPTEPKSPDDEWAAALKAAKADSTGE